MLRYALGGFAAAVVVIALSAAACRPAGYGGFPSGPVTLVVPFSPGGASDMIARHLAETLRNSWDYPVVLEHRPGAGTVVAANHVAKAPGDGHTLGFVVTAFMINAAVHRSLPYDTLRDFRGITQIGEAPVVLLANSEFPFQTVSALLAEAMANPGRIAYASSGTGTATHLAGELLASSASVDLLHVPYAGLAQALPDVMTGRVPLLFDVWHSARPYVESGRLRALGVASPKPLVGAPEIASLSDAVPGFAVSSIQGLVVPAGTPDSVVDELNRAVTAALRSPEFVARAHEFGMDVVASGADEFDLFLRREVERWTLLAMTAGIEITD